MAYSIDLRKRVIAAVDSGMRPTEAAKTFNVCRHVIYDWQHLLKKTNSLAPKTGYQKGHSPAIKDMKQFEIFVACHQECSGIQMKAEWEKLTGTKVSKDTILRSLHKIGYTSKKKLLTTQKQTSKNVSYTWKKSRV